MMRTCLYNLVLILLFTLYLPRYLWQRIVHKKYQRSFLYRFGFKKPSIPPLEAPVIWIHAVSLGEAKASYCFAKAAREAYPNATIVYSSVTETGFDEVEKTMPFLTTHFFLPFDFSWLIRPLVRKIKPNLVVFVEGDFWPNFLDAVYKEGAQTLLINGKISERSLKRYQLFKSYAHDLFSKLNYCCVQNTLYLERFQTLGIPADSLHVTGNIKLDAEIKKLSSQDREQLKKRLGIREYHRIITIGSTHEKEEELLLSALTPLLEQESSLKILVAPRHPERFKQVAQLLSKKHSYSTWSSLEPKTGDERVVLIDTIGQLKNCYQLSEIAIIGGSFVDVGGHNMLEPCEYGVPSLFGPYTYKQTEFTQIALKEGIGIQCSLADLSKNLYALLTSLERRASIKQRSQDFFTLSKGASLKSWNIAEELLSQKKERV